MNLDHMENLARTATPGPWTRRTSMHGDTPMPWIDSGATTVAEAVQSGIPREHRIANADYIAAANPQTVLALIAVARAAESYRESVLGWYRHRNDTRWWLLSHAPEPHVSTCPFCGEIANAARDAERGLAIALEALASI